MVSMAPLLFSVRIPTWLAIWWRNFFGFEDQPHREETPRNVIVFRLDQLGDVVLTTPLFRELKRLYPNTHCTLVVQPPYREVVSTNPNVDEILVVPDLQPKWLPKRIRRLLSAWWFYRTKLRQRRFDLAICPRWDVDESLTTMLCALTNAAKRVGYTSETTQAKQKINRGFDAAFDIVLPAGPVCHEVDRNLAIVKALGGSVGSHNPDIRLTPTDRRFANQFLKNRERRRMLVAIGIGARAAGRKWPLRNYAECIRCLDRQRPVQTVIVCSAEENAEAVELSAMLPVSPYVLSGLLLRQVCAVLERCDLFIGNDSGAAHLAAAMDCAVVVVSRHPVNGDPNHANSPVRFGPRRSRSQVLQPLSGEGECLSACQLAEPHCIKRVTVERVVAAIHELLPIEATAMPSTNVFMHDHLHSFVDAGSA